MSSTFDQLLSEIASSLRGLDATQTQLHPSARSGKWSIQQIIEHLLLTYSSTETVITTRLEKRAPTRAKPTLSHHIFRYAVTRCGYFPTGRSAPPLVTPGPTTHPVSGSELTLAATEHLTHLDHLFAEAEDIFGAKIKCASHGVIGPLTIDQWRRFHLVHGEHHLKQVAAIRRAHNL